MIGERILSRNQSEITIRNKQVAKALSLIIDIADQDGNTGLSQEKYRLKSSKRDSWLRIKDPLMVGENVLIANRTPIELETGEPYLTGMPLQGTLINIYGFYGWDNHPLIEPLFKVSVQLPRIDGQPLKTATLLVPNDLLTRTVPKESTNNASM